MTRTSNLADVLALRRVIVPKRYWGYFIIFVLLGFVIFRAGYQSIIHDEALSYNLFVASGLPAIFLTFDSNNHTLNSFLMWLSASVFGLSVFNLRLPALMGGAIYLIAAERICNRGFKNTRDYVLALLALSASPFLLDYMTVARGYSLALGFWMLALLFVCKQVSAQPSKTIRPEAFISMLAALSVSANLAFAFVNAALLLAYSLFVAMAYYRKELSGRQLALKYLFLSIPGGLLYFIITPSIFHFTSETLYFGVGSWRRTFDSVMMEFFDGFTPALLPENWQHITGNVVQTLPFCFIFLIATAGIVLLPKYIRNFVSNGKSENLSTDCADYAHLPWRAVPGEKSVKSAQSVDESCQKRESANNLLEQADSLWLLIALNLLITFILLSAARLFFEILLPKERTGMYFVPLFILMACLSIASLQKPSIQKTLAAIGRLCLLVMIVYFGLCIRVSNTRQWLYNAGTETTFKALLSTLEKYPDASVATNWLLEPGLNFYRTLYKTDGLKRFTRRADYNEFQLLVLLPTEDDDSLYIHSHRLKVLYTNPESGAIIALNRQP